MQIGTLSTRTGLSRDSLRFYEKRGLLPARRAINGYRDDPEEAVQWLGHGRTARQFGFRRAEIAADTLATGAGRPPRQIA
jgi:DNA-binding transcriptional MerR regulator